MKILYKIYARLFAREAFRKLNYHILRFALSGLGILNYYNLKISGEEYFITNILPKFINNNPVFLTLAQILEIIPSFYRKDFLTPLYIFLNLIQKIIIFLKSKNFLQKPLSIN